MARQHYFPEFGAAVKALLNAHGLSLRSQKIRTGIDHMTMKDMCDGISPRLEKVEQFATSFAEDVNKWRVLAGYAPVEDQAMADELQDKRETLAETEAAIAELSAEIDRVVNERNPGVGKGVRTFPPEVEADPARKLRALTALLAEARAGRLGRPKESS